MTETEKGSDLGRMDRITKKKRGLEVMMDDREKKRTRGKCRQEVRSNNKVAENIHVGTETRKYR